MKKQIALLLVLCMIFSLGACKKPAETPDNTGTNQTTGSTGNSTGTNAVSSVNTATGYTGVILPAGNDDLINPEKFGGKKLQIYGYSSDVYEDLENMERNTFIWMVRAAVDEWAYLNNVEVEYVGGYDQSVILTDIYSKGGKPDLLLYCNQFPLPALSGICRAFTQEEYDVLAEITGSYYLDMLSYKGQSYGVQSPWSGGQLFYYNQTQFEKYGVKSPGEYFMEDNWNWDTFETCITEITRDTDDDGKIDLYGSGTIPWLIPSYYMRRLDEDGRLVSLVRDSAEYARFVSLFNNAVTNQSSGKYNHCYIATSPRPATSMGDAEWYNFEHLHRELNSGDVIQVVPVPKYTNESESFFQHTPVYSSILTSCDEPEATLALLQYTLRVGMRYISDYSLGLYKCNYEGIRGASDYSLGWKQKFAKVVADRQADFDALTDWDHELYLKMQDYVLNAQKHFITYTLPDFSGGAILPPYTNRPPKIDISEVIESEEELARKFNEQYAK